MKNKLLYGAFIFIVLILGIIIVLYNSDNNIFMGLRPKAIYKNYKIYDVVEQKGLPCAEAIEILDSDETYDYYFNCLKSSQIYFVSDEEIIKIHDAYDRKIITKEKLYELGIIDRMVKLNGK